MKKNVDGMKRNDTSAVPKRFASVREASDFWDTHDAGDYPAALRPLDESVELSEDVPEIVALDPALSKRLRKSAQRRGLSLETLVNLWLEERVLARSH